MSTVKKFVSDTMIYGLSTIISRMVNFVMTPIFVSKFSPAQYGILTNLYAFASMINAVLAFGMETTYFRFLQKVEKQDRNRVFNNSFFITLIMAILFLVSVFVFVEPIVGWLVKDKPQEYSDYVSYVQLFAIILATDALAVVPFAKLRAQGRPVYFAALKLINILMFVGFNLFFIYILPGWTVKYSFWNTLAQGWFVDGWIGNVFIANMLTSVLTLVLLIPQIAGLRLWFDVALVKTMLHYSFPILIANISFIINENLDKMMLPSLLPSGQGDVDVGVYGAVAKIATFLGLIVTAFRLGSEPFFFSYAKNENAQKVYARIMEYFTIVMVLGMVGICANLDWLKDFIKGSDAKEQQQFWSGLFIVPLLLFNNVLLGIYMNLSVWYKLTDRTQYGLYISGVGAVLTVVLNFLLIPHYSYVGAAVSTSIVYLAMVGLSTFLGQKYYPIPYPFLKIVAYLVVGLGVSLLSFFMFDSNVWIGNLLLLGLCVGVIFTERKFIRTLLVRK